MGNQVSVILLCKPYCDCSPGSVWFQQPPHKMHPFRVRCIHCHKFVKWGTHRELKLLQSQNEDLILIPYQQVKQPAQHSVVTDINNSETKNENVPWN